MNVAWKAISPEDFESKEIARCEIGKAPRA
jgi:hypothetical protein